MRRQCALLWELKIKREATLLPGRLLSAGPHQKGPSHQCIFKGGEAKTPEIKIKKKW